MRAHTILSSCSRRPGPVRSDLSRNSWPVTAQMRRSHLAHSGSAEHHFALSHIAFVKPSHQALSCHTRYTIHAVCWTLRNKPCSHPTTTSIAPISTAGACEIHRLMLCSVPDQIATMTALTPVQVKPASYAMVAFL